MKIAIMQPYFLPYIGYWQLINAVDAFVLYDDVNYINKGWINRNNIIINGQKKLFTLSLKDSSQNKLINQIDIEDNFDKIKKTIIFNYKKAPYYLQAFSIIDEILNFQNKNLSLFIKNSIEKILNYLNIPKYLILSSELNKDNTLKGQNKILTICKEINANTYINPLGGTELYNREVFLKNGIELLFIKPGIIPYKQFNNEFIPNLSILDIMMHNSPDIIYNQLNNYELIK